MGKNLNFLLINRKKLGKFVLLGVKIENNDLPHIPDVDRGLKGTSFAIGGGTYYYRLTLMSLKNTRALLD